MPSLVQTVGVSKHYPSGGTVIRAVNDVSVSIERGEFVAIQRPLGFGEVDVAESSGSSRAARSRRICT